MNKTKPTLKNYKNHTSPTDCTKTQRSQHVHQYFYVNRMIFLITKTGKVNFLQMKRINSRSITEIINALRSDQTKYQTRELKITDIHGGNEFNSKALEYFLQPKF